MTMKNIILSLFTTSAIAVSAAANAETWSVDPAQSQLGFEVQQGEGTLKGSFADWQASIDFDVNAPEAAKITAQIKPASATTGNAQFDTTMPAKDWFDVADFPVAEFSADGASLVEGNTYQANGTLTIKGVSHPVKLDFTLDIEGDTAKAVGTAKVNRLDYSLGAGVGKDTINDVVTVTLDLTASR